MITAPPKSDTKRKILIAVHGLSESKRIFRPLGAVASGELGYEMHSITLPGFGQQHDGSWPSTDQMLSSVYQYIHKIREEDSDAEISLCGESMGAALINRLAPVLKDKKIHHVFLFAPAVYHNLLSYLYQLILGIFIGCRRADKSVSAEISVDPGHKRVWTDPRAFLGEQSLPHLMQRTQTVGFDNTTSVTIIAGEKDGTVFFSDIARFWKNRYEKHAHAKLITVQGGSHSMTRGAFATEVIRHALTTTTQEKTEDFNPLTQHVDTLLTQHEKIQITTLITLYQNNGGSLWQCYFIFNANDVRVVLETLKERATYNPYGASYCTLFSLTLEEDPPLKERPAAAPLLLPAPL